jgi:hypothetical protein
VTVNVKVFHKTDRENIFQEYEPGHRLLHVFEFGTPLLDTHNVMRLLDEIFAATNDHPYPGWEHISVRYHQDCRLRSLSVGDVVVIGESAYCCDRIGWSSTVIPTQEVEA